MPNLCGAKTRAGTPCQKAPINGATRCKFHGGKSTGNQKAHGNTNAAKPGSIFSKFLTTEENEMMDALELGKVDHLLRLANIRLVRALADEQRLGDKPELDALINRTGGGQNTVPKEGHFKRRDHRMIIDRCIARIESLEKTRAELLRNDTSGIDDEPKPETFVFHVVDGRKGAKNGDPD